MNYETSSDETLLLLSRSQNADAYYHLTQRYFNKRFALCRSASAALTSMFDAWDLNHAFFSTFAECLRNYQLGHGLFRSYLVSSLRHRLIREAERLHLFRAVPTRSLDAPVGEGITLHDVVPASGEDPRMYVDYFEEAKRLGKIGEALPDEVLEVARLRIDGCTYQEIANILNLNIKRTRKDYATFEEWIRKIVIGGRGDNAN